MMQAMRVFAALALLLVAVVPARAEVDAAAAEQLMRKSGLWQQLAGIGPQVKAGFLAAGQQAGAGMSATEAERAAKVIEAAYAEDKLRAVSAGVIAAGLDGRRVPALQRWYDSALGQRISRLEEGAAADTPDAQAALRDGAALLERMPAARRSLLADMVEATRSAEFMTQLTINTALAARAGVASAAPALPGPSSSELRALLEMQRPMMMKQLASITAAHFARVYAPLSTDELKKYLAFLKSPAGSHFTDVAARSVDAALVEGAADMGRRLPGTKDQSNT